ncbi:FAD-dependent oxidoreductase, partial [Candidatus Bipolaricaulota bacterium]|nr:FAD-dependent oxidoreductase [Candidatus Bipolaricaulota bacterium]
MSDNATMIMMTIDGRPATGKPGEMILSVARRLGIDIPALCADDRLEPFDSCGVCVVEVEGKGVVKSCSTPIEDGMIVISDSEAARKVRKASLELLLSNHWGDCIAPCQAACPAHTDCQGYVTLAANGWFDGGLKLLYEHLPFPASFGRICPAPCEDACRRTIAEEPLQIRHLKRFLGDRDVDYTPSVAEATGKRVAVVGGGPAGLSAAYFLRRRGHTVVVFEAMPRMGGMLRYGIPEYRLPHSVLDREIDVFRRMGIELRNGVRLGADISYQQLAGEYDAVFLGIGAWGAHGMGISGEEHPAVTQGTDFLRQVNNGDRPQLPSRVAVIGGGNTAMDAARCARRLGADVTVIYRRTEEEMPALAHEVAEAQDEQVSFRFLTQPVEFLTDGDSLRGIRCVRMELGQPDESGRRRPIPVEGSEFVVEVEAALLAVGQAVDSNCLTDSGIAVDRRGRLVADPRTGQCSEPRVFAGGDAVTGPSIAVEAVGAGHRAADAIHRTLRGQAASSDPAYAHAKEDVTFSDIGHPATAPRIRTAVRAAEARILDFDEYEAALADDEAVVAGQRCLECGCMSFNDCALRDYASVVEADQHAYAGEPPRKRRDERHPFIVRKVGKCVQCGRCVRVCRDVCGVAAIEFSGRGIDTEVQAPFNRAWQDSDCVSCGACVDACPTGALYDKAALAKQVPLDLDRTSTICALCGVGCEIDVLTFHGDYMRTVPSDGKSILCARGRYGWHAIASQPRIVSPMIRRGSVLV